MRLKTVVTIWNCCSIHHITWKGRVCRAGARRAQREGFSPRTTYS